MQYDTRMIDQRDRPRVESKIDYDIHIDIFQPVGPWTVKSCLQEDAEYAKRQSRILGLPLENHLRRAKIKILKLIVVPARTGTTASCIPSPHKSP